MFMLGKIMYWVDIRIRLNGDRNNKNNKGELSK